MESNLLKTAKKHENKREWSKAVRCYAEYMNKFKDVCDVEVYVSYAKSLRAAGDTNHAKEILTEGDKLYPKSEAIFKEFYSLYNLLGNWDGAKYVTSALININPDNSDYYFSLGQVYSFQSEYEKAKNMYTSGLKKKHGISFEQLIEKVQLGFTKTSIECTSEYIFINGTNNLGAFIHYIEDKKYITKITKYNRNAKREEAFYKSIRGQFPELKELAPAYIDSQVIDKVLYLTLEMIEGSSITSENTSDIMSTARKISSVKYEDIIKDYPNPNYLFQMRNRPVSIIIYFTKIHERANNERMFIALDKLIKQSNYPESVEKMIQRLKKQIMENHLYAFINPEKHYSLVHGDFIKKNMMIRKEDGLPQVFDWATFTTGPHFMDTARYLASSLIPYSKIKEIYLSKNNSGKNLSLIEKIFFLYALILLYLLTVKEKKAARYMDEYMLPALNDLEILVQELKNVKFGQAIELISNEREEFREKLKKSEQKVRTQTKRKEVIQRKYKNTIESKSWKITAPLRMIASWKNKS